MRPHVLVAGLIAFGASIAQAALAAPVVTVGATDIKQLQFDITPVTQANRYELWFKANDGAQWVKYTETPAQRPLIRISVSGHLLDWSAAKYQVKACNPSGCSNSNVVGVEGLDQDALGYFKPNGPGNNHRFGHTVTLSADGKTMAVATGETIATRTDVLVAHIYRRTTSTSGWRREARLVQPAETPFTSLPSGGMPLALSGDGNTFVLGVAFDQARGPTATPKRGAVFVWRRGSTGWQPAGAIADSILIANDWYGFNVELDDAAQTLAVWHQYASAGATDAGIVDLYRWHGAPDNEFRPAGIVPIPITPGSSTYCGAISLSGNGQRLFRTCSVGLSNVVQIFDVTTDFFPVEIGRLTDQGYFVGVDSTFDGKRFIATTGSGAAVFDETASGWVRDGILGNGGGGTIYNHNDGAISRDGKIVALGNRDDRGAGIGSVTIHERRASGWILRKTVVPGSSNYQWAGHSVALGDNGKVLAVGAPFDPSAASGIDGDRADASELERGAVWLY